MIGRLLLVGWILIGIVLVIVTAAPRIGTWLPFPGALRPLFVIFTLISFIYGVVRLYRTGMKRRN